MLQGIEACAPGQVCVVSLASMCRPSPPPSHHETKPLHPPYGSPTILSPILYTRGKEMNRASPQGSMAELPSLQDDPLAFPKQDMSYGRSYATPYGSPTLPRLSPRLGHRPPMQQQQQQQQRKVSSSPIDPHYSLLFPQTY